ncbi:MAG: hypothetical protein R3C97_03150 [Geminicoccaceae bacterium]
MAVIMAVVLRNTSWGRYLFAIGGNEQAARLTGIPVDRIKIRVYMLAGLTAAIAGILTAGYGGWPATAWARPTNSTSSPRP